MAYLQFEYEGKIYKGCKSEDPEVEAGVNMVYENFSDLTRMKFNLEEGGFIIIGKIALQTGIFRFIP